MKIFVLVKEVPDTYGDRKLDLETGLADRGAGDLVLDEITERALEVALSHADKNEGTEVVALAMAPAGSTASVRRALAIGAGSAVHIADEQLAGADLGLTAETLAAAIRRAEPDLVITGNLSTDGSGGVMAAMLAEHLGWSQATALTSVEITGDSVTGVRGADAGGQPISASLPAVISITEALPDARFPNFKGIMAAKKKPLEVLTLDDLGVSADPAAAPRTIMTAVAEKPPRAAGVKIVDEGDAADKLVEYLVQNRLV
ncbi:electron transfer flavoprotein subunit beta/FixA family protein [Microbacterium foliorum]|uniref:Electron transfer flavoprotein subunit beta n=1 Tax=Microbacterium foliorum TaxID=104336 RepID=A0A0F0KRD2_9MICO|nr:electron transfer flavoprotein subunit beta/FixA family protein [Microbacterium foliorum]AXL13246.1 electron transfer flavoprotein subunit beta/FixA family protein [Microbacterium foliorum]KJL23044.1 Electron transfer flavoprotein subunit beta [Microbacterium foliorum]